MQLFVKALVVEAGGDRLLGTSEPFTVGSGAPDTLDLAVTVSPADVPASVWDLRLELCDAGTDTVVAHADAGTFPGLGQVPVEGAFQDFPVGVGPVQPNPAPGAIAIPIRLDRGTPAPVSLEVWDVTGRLVWREEPRRREGHYAGLLQWAGRDLSGRPVGSGVFFCRVRVGDASFKRRVVMVR
jgi:hypothetical protein